jgi:hypothetical protein
MMSLYTLAARERGLSKRGVCTASLSSKQQELLVEADAAEIDLDAFGVDFGTGTPAAAFEIKKSEEDCCFEYRIYSLAKPFRLLRTLTGAGFFGASDVDFDGRIEIWASDGAAVDGIETLGLGEIDFPPIVVFRFAHGRLLDVSAEFQAYFDQEIDSIRAEIVPRDLQNFKNSDGKLMEMATPANVERLHRLRVMKIKVLEIVWAYLYSGRDEQAWHSLAEMWPPGDFDRIRGALLQARARGLHREADATSAGPPAKKKKVRIFNMDPSAVAGLKAGVIPP